MVAGLAALVMAVEPASAEGRLDPGSDTATATAKDEPVSDSLSQANDSSPVGDSSRTSIGLFEGMSRNVVESFIGWNLALHAGGIASTAILSPSGADYASYRYFHGNPGWGYASFPAVIGGGLVPILLPGSLWLSGWLKDDLELSGAAAAAAQAVVISFATNTLLKAYTGRPPPDSERADDMGELSRTFRFGFNRGGVFHGWPSGHAMVTMAMASSLASYYGDTMWMQVVSYGWAAYMVYGVVSFEGGGMHWLSDGIAGALMGYAIGSTVGRNTRRLVDGKGGDDLGPELTLLPFSDGTAGGFLATMVF